MEPVLSRSWSSAWETSRAWKRAEPKKTTVSWIRSRRKTGHGLLIFAKDAEGTSVGGVDEVEVCVGEGCAFEVFGKVGVG